MHILRKLHKEVLSVVFNSVSPEPRQGLADGRCWLMSEWVSTGEQWMNGLLVASFIPSPLCLTLPNPGLALLISDHAFYFFPAFSPDPWPGIRKDFFKVLFLRELFHALGSTITTCCSNPGSCPPSPVPDLVCLQQPWVWLTLAH